MRNISKLYNLWALVLHRAVPKLPRKFGIRIHVRAVTGDRKKKKQRARCSTEVQCHGHHLTDLRHLLPPHPLALSKFCLPPPPVLSSLSPMKVSKNTIFQIFILKIWSVLSFIIFICYIASLAASFMMAPLLEFLLALFLFFAYASKLNEKFKGVHWPLADFLRCVTAAIIYFAISIAAVSKYSDGASKAAGVFGFAATIVFAIDFYITFNDLVTFLKQGSSDSPEGHKTEDEDSDSDSD
uniref:CKLF like MARVEL transmembrane domain containing 3 n=5 Tax=Passeriformes TaxID=9126 RepID=A0A8C9NBE4_SERCA